MTVYNDMMRAVKKRRVDDRGNHNVMANRYPAEKKELEKRRKKETKKKEVRRENRENDFPVIKDDT